MQTYLVGGAVRDKLLGIPVKDKDWVVIGASAQQLLDQGFQQVGKDFPVFLHPETKEEHALGRIERKSAPGYTGFEFDTAATVTLEQDLMRRDLTINAIAENENGDLIDPYNGRQDIENRILRHVSPAFIEDPLRVLRVAKFAARFSHLGFTIAADTLALMQTLVDSGELEFLVKERIWQEFEEVLKGPAPWVFIETLKDCQGLAVLLPEIANLFGVPQPEKYHPEIDTGVHVLMCLQQACKLSSDPVVRYAALMHDVGKGVTDKQQWPSHYGHEKLGLDLLEQIRQRLGTPKEFAKLAALVCEHHTKLHRVKELRASTLLKLLEALDAIRRPERLDKFLLACEADSRGRTGLEDLPYPQGEYLLTIFRAVQTIDVGRLITAEQPKNPKEFVQQLRLDAIENQLSELRT